MWFSGHFAKPFYEDRYFTTLFADGGGVGPRYTPTLDWIPRWMEPSYASDEAHLESGNDITYDEPGMMYDEVGVSYDGSADMVVANEYSVLKRWYHLGLREPLHTMQRFSSDLVPTFFLGVSAPRAGWMARYDFKSTVIPRVQLIVTQPAMSISAVRRVLTPQALLFEPTDPVWYWNGSAIVLKNLESVAYTVDSASGYVDISDALDENPILEDSLITVYNAYGDADYLDQDDSRWDGTRIQVSNDGSYTIQYLSSSLREQISESLANLVMDSEVIQVVKYDFLNLFDEYAAEHGIVRLADESNDSLRRRCQHLSIAKTVEQKITAALGGTTGLSWGTMASLSFTGSGIVSVAFAGLSEFSVFTENPAKDGSNFILQMLPVGAVQVMVKGLSISPEAYTVSGAVIVPTGEPLLSARSEDVSVTYRVNVYEPAMYGEEVVSVIPGVVGSRLVRGIAAKDVTVRDAVRKSLTWRWNQEQGSLSGLAAFE